MKITLSITILFLVSICKAQIIKVTVNEAQILAKHGTHTNQAVVDAPDEDRGLKQIDCDYVFDLQEKTSTFFSRSLGGVGNTLPIVNITRDGSQYIIETDDYGRLDSSFSYHTKIYIDTENKTMTYTWYDSYLDRSFVSRTGKIKMTLEGMQ
ncbi:hypothetical protein N9E11_01440 [Crocinitomicaceae bacterium]|nr:hypothetical protein [Crocinitomicaceae bacterium]MDB4606296.1 hypothetical protein [Crocinitomicaceae bacterium]